MIGASKSFSHIESQKPADVAQRSTASRGWHSVSGVVGNRLRDNILYDVREEHFPELQAAVRVALDNLCLTSSTQNYTDLTIDLMDMLHLLKLATSDRVWQNALLPVARDHEMIRRMHQCPFTKHSFSRPRGYPGDAELIDFVYKHPDAQPAVHATTDAGRTILDVTVNVPACEAVRNRKQVLARKIDEIAEARPGAEVLAVACGHLREAESSIALKEGKIARLVATDQDQISLGKAAGYRNTVSANIDVRNLSVRHFIAAKHGLGKFDLVYAAGLYDYLDARVAAKLTSSLFSLLKSGGRLLIPNFLKGLNQEAYMEIYMDWYLTYRTRHEIEAFAGTVPSTEIHRTNYFEDGSGTIGYLEIQRA